MVCIAITTMHTMNNARRAPRAHASLQLGLLDDERGRQADGGLVGHLAQDAELLHDVHHAAAAVAAVEVRVELNRGGAGASVWTTDFSYDYVRINAEYRT